jgi:type I restriction enzyme M protein
VNPSTDLVNRLWKLCSLLRKDGITYQQYVTELTYLLFLKMLKEEKLDKKSIPTGYRWSDLNQAPSNKKLPLYKKILSVLGDPDGGASRAVQAIYSQSATVIRDPSNLDTLVAEIDLLDWFSTTRDSLGDLYEGLLQKNAEETKRGAGQYFTPRVYFVQLVGRAAIVSTHTAFSLSK